MNSPLSCCRVEVDVDLIESAKKELLSVETILLQKAKVLSLLGNDVRLRIVYLFLKYDRMCVCDLSDVLQMKQSPISQHLRKLKDGGLLVSQREGMTIFYSIALDQKDNLIKMIEG